MISIKLLKSGVFRQSYAVLCVNLLTLVYGAASGEIVLAIDWLQVKSDDFQAGPHQ
jgi:hypothetical protein